MIVALRYMDKEGGFWEVRTEASLDRHTSLRQFAATDEIEALATRAIQEPGVWVEGACGKRDDDGE